MGQLSLGLLARQAGFTQFWRQWIPHLRARIEATLAVVGAEKPFGRNACVVGRADGDGSLSWTLSLDRLEAVAVVGIVRTAAIILLAAVSGMRSSELMELEVGSCRPPEHYGPGLVRYRLASKVIKGQQLGGLADEWVVIEPAYRAAHLLEQLHNTPENGVPLLGRFAFDVRYTWFRNWVNGPAGQRLGLTPVPEAPVSLRALRRTLAIELAYRPGGLLAANCTSSTSRRQQRKGMRLDLAGRRPSCWLRSTSTKPSATWIWSGPSSATTSKGSCPPVQEPAS